MNNTTLEEKIKNKTENVVVVGLGYVGLQVLTLLVSNNIPTYGVDTDKEKIALLKNGKSPMPEYQDIVKKALSPPNSLRGLSTKLEDFLNIADIVIVAVPTPINDNTKKPNLKYTMEVIDKIGQYIKDHKMNRELLVILESTIPPGTTRQLSRYLKDEYGIEVENKVMLVHCPERIDPGNPTFLIEDIPRVVGGLSERGIDLAYLFYSSILKAKVYPVENAEIAEMAKVFENTFRDVNIALVNELAMKCDKEGIDLYGVIQAASTKPFGFMPFYPGPGVGGHCIPKDPYYLLSAFNDKPTLIQKAREINESMPHYITEKIVNIAKRYNRNNILLLGAAYKKNTSDTRNSPALVIFENLSNVNNLRVVLYDPYIPQFKDVQISGELGVWVLLTDHDILLKELEEIPNTVTKDIILFDTRNAARHLKDKFERYFHLGGWVDASHKD